MDKTYGTNLTIDSSLITKDASHYYLDDRQGLLGATGKTGKAENKALIKKNVNALLAKRRAKLERTEEGVRARMKQLSQEDSFFSVPNEEAAAIPTGLPTLGCRSLFRRGRSRLIISLGRSVIQNG
jgi:hypothetical protein